MALAAPDSSRIYPGPGRFLSPGAPRLDPPLARTETGGSSFSSPRHALSVVHGGLRRPFALSDSRFAVYGRRLCRGLPLKKPDAVRGVWPFMLKFALYDA